MAENDMNDNEFNEEEPEDEEEGLELELDGFVFGRGPKDITVVPKGYDPAIVRKYVNEKITSKLLFSVGSEYQTDLDSSNISNGLRQEFESHDISLSQNVTASTEKPGSKWLIIDEENNQTYDVRKDNDNLNVYTPELAPGPFWRIRYLMDFYYLQDLLGKIRDFLARQEETEAQYNRSICCATILGEVGQDEYRAFGRDYFRYLAEHPLASEEFESLLICYTAHTPELNSRILAERIETHLGKLGPQVESDFQAGLEYRELDALLNNDLYQAQEASAAEATIFGIQEEPKRLDELVKVYLEMSSYGGEEYLIPWAARKLRRAAIGEGEAKVISALRRAEESLTAQEMDEEDIIFTKTRIYHARLFFGDNLTETEQSHLSEHGQNQLDLLSLDSDLSVD